MKNSVLKTKVGARDICIPFGKSVEQNGIGKKKILQTDALLISAHYTSSCVENVPVLEPQRM